jgi:uncharacterized membrane protein
MPSVSMTAAAVCGHVCCGLQVVIVTGRVMVSPVAMTMAVVATAMTMVGARIDRLSI